MATERNDLITVTSIYGAKEHQPAVMFKWGGEAGIVSVNDARKHALRVLEAAEAAEGDAFVADWLREHAKADDPTIALFLRDFRKTRILRSEKEGGV